MKLAVLVALAAACGSDARKSKKKAKQATWEGLVGNSVGGSGDFKEEFEVVKPKKKEVRGAEHCVCEHSESRGRQNVRQ